MALLDSVSGCVQDSLTTSEVPQGNVLMLSITEAFPEHACSANTWICSEITLCCQ